MKPTIPLTKEMFLSIVATAPVVLEGSGIGRPPYSDAQIAMFFIGFAAGNVSGEVGEAILRRAGNHLLKRFPHEFDPEMMKMFPGGGTLH